MGYKVHLTCDGEAEMPLAFMVAPANENEKRYAAALLSQVDDRVRVETIICDKQYSSRRIRDFIRALGAEPVILYPKNKKKGIKGLLRVDKKFRVHGPERLRRLYRLKSSVERVNSRLATLTGKISFKGLKAAVMQVSYAILAMPFMVQTAMETEKPSKARSIIYYA